MDGRSGERKSWRVPLALMGIGVFVLVLGTAPKCVDHESLMNMEGDYSGWAATDGGPAAELYARSMGEELCNYTTQTDWDNYQGFCSTEDWDMALGAGGGGYATGFWDCRLGYGQALIWHWGHEWSVDGEDGEEYDCEHHVLREGLPLIVVCLGPS